MIRPWLVLCALVVSSEALFAQELAPRSMLRPVAGPVRDAGVYHVGLGTWTRRADTANGIMHDVIYANTCPVGYYAGLFTNEYYMDEGRIPGPNGPVLCDTARFSRNVGCSCSYDVCGFQIGYCSGINGPGQGGGPGPVTVNIGFQGAYVDCSAPIVPPGGPGTFTLSGLPGAGLSPSVKGCWLVTVDLEAASLGFAIPADGPSCTWNPAGDLPTHHLFGWTFQNLTSVSGVGQSFVGPLIAGSGGPFAPTPTCSMVDGTRWDTLTCPNQGGGLAKWPNNLTEDGYGMDTQDLFRDDTTGGPTGAPSGPGCYYFQSNPVPSFHLRLFANGGCAPVEPGVPICRPQIDFAMSCPCSPPNNPTTPGAGCNGLSPGNVPTGGAKLTSAGTASISGTTPGVDTLQFTVTGLPSAAAESCFLLAGPTFSVPLTFGQGLRCVTGALKRLQIHSPAPGTSTWPAAGDFQPTIQARENQLTPGVVVAGSVRHYFVQYRQALFNPGCAFPNNFNASNAESVTWTP